jgi:hypothetical protein
MAALHRSLWLRVPLGFLALAAVAWLAWYGLAWWQLDRLKEEIRAKGIPMTEAEVLPARIPDEENAAPLLQRAEAVWREIKSREDFIDARLRSLAPELAPEKFDRERLAQLTAQMQWPEMQEFFRLMREAVRRPAAVPERDSSKGYVTETGLLNPLFAAVQFSGAKAWLAAKEGNQSEAAEDVLTTARLASFGLRHDFLLGWMIGVSFDQMAIGAAQSVMAELPAGSFRMQDWQALADLWARHAAEARADLVRTMDGERVLLGMWFFERVLAGRISLMQEIAKSPNVMPSDEAGLARWIGGLYVTALAPLLVSDYAAYLRLMVSVREALSNGQTGKPREESFVRSVPRWALLARTTAPSYDRMPKLLEEYEVSLQLARLGLALEDFRSREGKYPASLQDLGLPDERITDPFSGRPFIYHTENNNVLVYSVGFDRKDDGGLHAPPKEQHDIVWRVERATKPA